MHINTKLNYSELFEILKLQNWWYKSCDNIVHTDRDSKRPEYSLCIDEINSNDSILLQGPRYAGKTTIIKTAIDLLINQEQIEPEQILYMNLEDHHFINLLEAKLLEDSLEIYKERINPSNKIYFFIDEIQKIDNYEDFLSKHSSENLKIIATSSLKVKDSLKAKNVFPLSFKEYLDFKKLTDKTENLEENKSLIKKYFYDYLKQGGILDLLEDNTEPHRDHEYKEHLMDYFNSVLLEDVVEKYKIRNTRVLKQIGIALANNVSHFFSFNK